jgi:transposase-like protein
VETRSPPRFARSDRSVDEIERAAAALILGQAIEPLAAAAGLSPEALTVWVQRYREAGRRGLG